jgi:hypothetical protein
MLFDIESDQFGEFRKEINNAVNAATMAALRAGMRTAGADIKIEINLMTAGEKELRPEYKYKTKVKIGESYENGKGTIVSDIGLKAREDGYWSQVMMSKQLSMVE